MQGGALSPLSRELLPQSSERHQGGERTNWELALHLGQFINWIRGHLRPQANPREAPLSPWSAVRLLGTKTGGLGSAQSFRSWESLKKVADHCTASVSPSVQWPGSSRPSGLSELSWELRERMGRYISGAVMISSGACVPGMGLKSSQKRVSQPRKPCLTPARPGVLDSGSLVTYLLQALFLPRSHSNIHPTSLMPGRGNAGTWSKHCFGIIWASFQTHTLPFTSCVSQNSFNQKNETESQFK